MTKMMEIYKCELCGNMVEVVHASAGQLTCCGKAMVLMQEKTADANTEKHVPVIEKVAGGFKVNVGSIPHPMEEKHYIEWIEIQFDNKVGRKYLKPGDKAEALFMGIDAESIRAREYCNVHGLWKS